MLSMSSMHRVVVGAVVFMIVACLSGCGLNHFVPNRPYKPEYVVNRDGSFYVGSRCVSDGFKSVGVWVGQWPTESDAGTSEDVKWSAVSEPGVSEFELFSSSQRDVQVAKGDGWAEHSERIYILMRDFENKEYGISVILDEIEEGGVWTQYPTSSWDEYMSISDNEFGC